MRNILFTATLVIVLACSVSVEAKVDTVNGMNCVWIFPYRKENSDWKNRDCRLLDYLTVHDIGDSQKKIDFPNLKKIMELHGVPNNNKSDGVLCNFLDHMEQEQVNKDVSYAFCAFASNGRPCDEKLLTKDTAKTRIRDSQTCMNSLWKQREDMKLKLMQQKSSGCIYEILFRKGINGEFLSIKYYKAAKNVQIFIQSGCQFSDDTFSLLYCKLDNSSRRWMGRCDPNVIDAEMLKTGLTGDYLKYRNYPMDKLKSLADTFEQSVEKIWSFKSACIWRIDFITENYSYKEIGRINEYDNPATILDVKPTDIALKTCLLAPHGGNQTKAMVQLYCNLGKKCNSKVLREIYPDFKFLNASTPQKQKIEAHMDKIKYNFITNTRGCFWTYTISKSSKVIESPPELEEIEHMKQSNFIIFRVRYQNLSSNECISSYDTSIICNVDKGAKCLRGNATDVKKEQFAKAAAKHAFVEEFIHRGLYQATPVQAEILINSFVAIQENIKCVFQIDFLAPVIGSLQITNVSMINSLKSMQKLENRLPNTNDCSYDEGDMFVLCQMPVENCSTRSNQVIQGLNNLQLNSEYNSTRQLLLKDLIRSWIARRLSGKCLLKINFKSVEEFKSDLKITNILVIDNLDDIKLFVTIDNLPENSTSCRYISGAKWVLCLMPMKECYLESEVLAWHISKRLERMPRYWSESEMGEILKWVIHKPDTPSIDWSKTSTTRRIETTPSEFTTTWAHSTTSGDSNLGYTEASDLANFTLESSVSDMNSTYLPSESTTDPFEATFEVSNSTLLSIEITEVSNDTNTNETFPQTSTVSTTDFSIDGNVTESESTNETTGWTVTVPSTDSETLVFANESSSTSFLNGTSEEFYSTYTTEPNNATIVPGNLNWGNLNQSQSTTEEYWSSSTETTLGSTESSSSSEPTTSFNSTELTSTDEPSNSTEEISTTTSGNQTGAIVVPPVSIPLGHDTVSTSTYSKIETTEPSIEPRESTTDSSTEVFNNTTPTERSSTEYSTMEIFTSTGSEEPTSSSESSSSSAVITTQISTTNTLESTSTESSTMATSTKATTEETTPSTLMVTASTLKPTTRPRVKLTKRPGKVTKAPKTTVLVETTTETITTVLPMALVGGEQSVTESSSDDDDSAPLSIIIPVVILAILLLGGIIVGICVYKRKNKKSEKPRPEDIEEELPKPKEEPKPNPAAPKKKKKVQYIRRHDLHPDLLPKSQFQYKGPLKMNKNMKGPMTHLEDETGEKSHSIREKVEIDPTLNEIHRIGTDVEQYTGEDNTASIEEKAAAAAKSGPPLAPSDTKSKQKSAPAPPVF